jgi:hypothetical protein
MSVYVGVIQNVTGTHHLYADEVAAALSERYGCVVDIRYWTRTKSGRRDAFFTCRPAPTKDVNAEHLKRADELSLDDYYPESHDQLRVFGVK